MNTSRGRAAGAEDARLLASLAAHYTPGPMSAARRAAFDAALRQRLARRQRRRGPALAAALGAAALVWALLPAHLGGGPAPAPPPPSLGQPPAAPLAAGSSEGFEAELFDPRALGAAPDAEEDAPWPDEYLVLASVFLDH